ncbi:hypothetical protein RFI_27474 [Reticulomyxa filosa]|uniref:Uncharacterized protein n=1 Tax=Reticulomyxa filosa TaxID=46433 RepID=X6M7F6_RETFI|nr:hypothetical protein RFI_27474 [Reticulomyxa filosa]|eukprot:ETO09903.1 hypothetical protein RFI_27474 [Reticulomyxa filosa]
MHWPTPLAYPPLPRSNFNRSPQLSVGYYSPFILMYVYIYMYMYPNLSIEEEKKKKKRKAKRNENEEDIAEAEREREKTFVLEAYEAGSEPRHLGEHVVQAHSKVMSTPILTSPPMTIHHELNQNSERISKIENNQTSVHITDKDAATKDLSTVLEDNTPHFSGQGNSIISHEESHTRSSHDQFVGASPRSTSDKNDYANDEVNKK